MTRSLPRSCQLRKHLHGTFSDRIACCEWYAPCSIPVGTSRVAGELVASRRERSATEPVFDRRSVLRTVSPASRFVGIASRSTVKTGAGWRTTTSRERSAAYVGSNRCSRVAVKRIPGRARIS
jgi:hypothetical protein